MMRIDRYHAYLRRDMRKITEGNCTVIYGAFDPEEADKRRTPLRASVQTDLGCCEPVILAGAFDQATDAEKLSAMLLNGFMLDDVPMVSVVMMTSLGGGGKT